MSKTSQKQVGKQKTGRLPAKPFGTGQPVPLSPGRPRKKLDLTGGISEKLAAVRAASKWVSDKLPGHPDVRFWVEFRRKHQKEFVATLERLEKEHVGGVDGGGVVEADESSERLEELALGVLGRAREKAREIVEGKS